MEASCEELALVSDSGRTKPVSSAPSALGGSQSAGVAGVLQINGLASDGANTKVLSLAVPCSRTGGMGDATDGCEARATSHAAPGCEALGAT